MKEIEMEKIMKVVIPAIIGPSSSTDEAIDIFVNAAGCLVMSLVGPFIQYRKEPDECMKEALLQGEGAIKLIIEILIDMYIKRIAIKNAGTKFH